MVEESAAGFEREGAQRRVAGHLELEECPFAALPLGRENLDRVPGLGEPSLYEQPSGIDGVDELIQVAARHLTAFRTAPCGPTLACGVLRPGEQRRAAQDRRHGFVIPALAAVF